MHTTLKSATRGSSLLLIVLHHRKVQSIMSLNLIVSKFRNYLFVGEQKSLSLPAGGRRAIEPTQSGGPTSGVEIYMLLGLRVQLQLQKVQPQCM